MPNATKSSPGSRFVSRSLLPIVGLCVGLLSAGCTTPNTIYYTRTADDTLYYTKVGRSPRLLVPRRPETVETFTVTPPPRPHTDVGIVQVVAGSWSRRDFGKMMEELRQHAATVGCDAMLITSIDRRDASSSRAGKLISPSIQASCIVYNDVPPPPG